MLNHVTRNITLMVKNRWTWKPSKVAVRTALSTLAAGSLVCLCAVPALAAASLNTTRTTANSGFQGLEFLAFIALVALAPLMILMSASVSRMVLLRAGLMNEFSIDSISEPHVGPKLRNDREPRQIQVPNAQFGSCKVALPIAPVSEVMNTGILQDIVEDNQEEMTL